MVNRCIICKKYWDKGCGRSFHKFPKNSEVKKIWIDALDLKDAELKRATVCSDHFLSEDLLTNLSGARLKLNAVPNIIPVSSDIHHNESNKDIEPDNDNSVEDLPQISLFPSDGNLRKDWLHTLGYQENKCLPKRADICSRHFDSNDFEIKPGGRKYLKRGAVPKPLLPSTQSSQEHSLNLSSVSSTNPIHSELVENLYNLSSSIEIHIKNSESDDENALTTRCAEEEVIGGTVTNRISPKIELDTSSECEEEVNNVPTIEAVEETIEYLSDSSTLTAISEKSLGSDDPSNSEKITSNVSKTHLEFEKEYPVKEKRTTKLSRYFEDYSVEYMNSRAKKNWQTARKTISEQKTRIQRIQRQNGRMKSRVEKLQSLLKHLFHNYEFKKKG